MIWIGGGDQICLCAVHSLINWLRERSSLKLLLVFVSCAGIGLLAGCHSTGPSGSSKLASVEIRWNTPGQISEVTSEVFEADGYEVARGGPTHLVFEKKASTMNNIAYGNWMDSAVWERVKASIEPVGEATFRLECQAYFVRDRGGTTEEELKMGGMHSHTYQKLLDRVAKRLNQTH